MVNSGEVDDPSQHAAAGTATPARRKHGSAKVPPLVKYNRRPELAEELGRWYALDEAAQRDELRRAAGGEKRWSIETFVHLVRQAHAAGNRRAHIEAFNAFATRATPLLMGQAFKYDAGDGEDHAQDVFLIVEKEVQAGKAEYAEANFADYAMRKAIDAYRRKEATIESQRERVEPSMPGDEDEGDPVDPLHEIEDRMASPEIQGILRNAVGKLEGKLRDVLIQYHIHRLTLEELAEHHQVDPTTISNWLKQALKLAGRQGGQ